MSFNVNVNLGGHGAPPGVSVGLAPPGGAYVSVGSGPPAIVRLSTEKMSYVGGETINGHVLMSSLYPFYAKGVFVKIEGFEHCRFQEVETRTEGSGEHQHTHRHVHVRQDRNEFFCKTQAVYPQEGMVQPGQFNFPFSFTLPDELPGSYREEGGNWDHHVASGYIGEIMYNVEVRVESDRGIAAQSTVPFVVSERSKRAQAPSHAKNSKTFAFVKGRLDVQVWLDHSTYFPGNTVIAKLEANNTSVKATDAIYVNVYRVLDLRAGHHHKHISDRVYRQQYPGLEPSFYGVRFLPFQIPINFQPSTTIARTVKCHYEFTVECSIPGAINLRTALDCSIRAPQFMFADAPPGLPPLAQIPNEASFRPPWQPDPECNNCNKCGAGFGLFTRRHHCRHCAKIFCDSCSKRNVPIPLLGYAEPVRVCDGCFDVASGGGKRFQEAPELDSSPLAEPDWQRPPVSVPDAAAPENASAPPLAAGELPPK